MNRRGFCAALAIGAGATVARAQAPISVSSGSTVLNQPRIVGPIPITPSSIPFVSTAKSGTFTAGLLKQLDYVEEEYFLFGHANIYGPGLAAPDRIARDQHGNALGGLRTPWVDVPDGVYVTSVSPENRLRAGYRPFNEAKMRQLYGSRERYVTRVNRQIGRMVRDGWVLPHDESLRKLNG